MSDRSVRRITCLLAIFLAGCCSTFAGVIGLTWDPSTGASGYRVYYGPEAGEYLPTPLYEGPATSVTIDHNALIDCTTWHFAVTAYNLAGESGFSEDVASWPRPTINNASPPAALQGSQFTLTISGGSFDPGVIFEIDNPYVVLESLSGISCGEIQALVTVEPMAQGVVPAEVGDFSITVTNPDGLSSTEQVFEVLINPARFDVNQSIPTTDGRLDGLDTIWIATLGGVQFGGADYDPDFDFDGDGWIDGNELAYIGSNFGLCWDGSSWKLSACP